MKKLLCFLIALIFFSSCQNQSSKEKTISISGAFALYPMAVKWAEEYKKLHPDVKIDVSAGGAGKGMTDALSGIVDLGMVSRTITKEELDKGAWYIAVTIDAVLPTINSKNPALKELLAKGLSKESFIKIFDGELKQWNMAIGENAAQQINVYTRSDASGASEMWAKYLGMKPEDIKGTGVYGDPGISDAVKKDANSIGYNNVIYVYDISTKKKYDGIEVIPIDVNGNGTLDADENYYGTLEEISKAIKEGKYPSPPARDLYFVAKGKPSNNSATLDFLKWILNEGQKYVYEGGFVELNKEKINDEIKKLN